MSANYPSTNDHDLLIELRTEMRGVREDIKNLQTNTATRLLSLENDHIGAKEYQDHELRIRRLEMWGGMAIGAISLIQLIGFGYLISKLS